MTLSQYINFWDTTIKNLFVNPSINSYPMNLGIKIQKDFMPEPFIGNPDDFSFVIVNLNPGAGVCHSCFKQQNVIGTFVNKVKAQGYSNAVKDFPYLRDGKVVGLVNWNNSPGRKWWKKKERWIKHMLNVCDTNYKPKDPIPEGYYPFAMELFAWHTEKWPSTLNNKMKKTGKYGTDIYNNVIEPLHEAIQKSKFKFAFCVGKPIGDIISSFGFNKLNSNPIQPLPLKKKRFYDVYHDGNGCYIINTWAQGGNTYPSISFEDKEKELISKYIIKKKRP